MRTITFNELRKIKDSLPSGSMHRIADELGLHVDTVRNFFGGHNFKEGKSVGFSGDHRVCIPKKGKDVKAFRGIFTRDKQKEVYPAEEIDSIVCWHPRTPEFRRPRSHLNSFQGRPFLS